MKNETNELTVTKAPKAKTVTPQPAGEPRLSNKSWITGSDNVLSAIAALTKNITPKSDVSDKYSPMQTKDVHKIITDHGWKLVKGAIHNRQISYTKHMLVYNHPDYITPDGDEIRIILKNSFDRTSNLQLSVGVFRLVCSNGLVVMTKDFGTIKQRHLGIDKKEFEGTLATLLGNTESIMNTMKRMKGKVLKNTDKLLLAEKLIEVTPDWRKRFTITPESLLTVRRVEDKGNFLWPVFNTIQENLMKGNVEVKSEKTGKTKQLKAISNAFDDIKLNAAYFETALEFLN